MRLMEAVPNFSEGRNRLVIDEIVASVERVPGVMLLGVDIGYSANRTVVTFAGQPEAVAEAAFQAISTAALLIDMRNHKGEHPRIGATDVCPFVPITGISMHECSQFAVQLGRRVGSQLAIPVYLYGETASTEARRSLSYIRKGQYEGLDRRMHINGFQPDFGPHAFNAQSGATVIGARTFLIAYNINLNTKSSQVAAQIASHVRQSGRLKRDEKGELERDSNGKPLKLVGTLKECRALGWYVDEYERAQVSLNLLNYHMTGMHDAFEEVSRQAERLGCRVTGSEIIGLVPLQAMLSAGNYYYSAAKEGSLELAEPALLAQAVRSLGLSELAPFNPEEKILEYKLKALNQI